MYTHFKKSLVLGCVVLAGSAAFLPDIPETTRIVRANTRFALDLMQALPAENTIVSPFSISTAMAMTYAGAGGATKKEFDKALYFDEYKDDFHPAYGRLQKQLEANLEEVEWGLANRIWAHKNYTIGEDFLAINRNSYNAPAEQVQFGTPGVTRRINSWVESKTNDRIKDLIPKGALTVDTRMVLVNAVYFKADWAFPFPKENTRKEQFTTETGQQVWMDLMYQYNHLPYFETKKYQAVSLPYRSGKQSMIIVLPREGTPLKEIENQFAQQKELRFFKKAEEQEVQLHLPRFTLEYNMQLAPYFKDRGMTTAFGPSANFCGINEDVWIDAIIHQAFIEVAEEGTEAAAATAVIIVEESLRIPAPDPPKIFRADHPFLFFIMDNDTRSILFMGKVMNPPPNL